MGQKKDDIVALDAASHISKHDAAVDAPSRQNVINTQGLTQKRRANKNTISAIDSKSSNEVNNNDLYPDEEEATVETDVFDDFNVSEDVQKNLDATQLYLGEIGFSPLLSAEEEVLYARKALKGDERARERMIVSNLRLVVKIARRYKNRGLALLDLI